MFHQHIYDLARLRQEEYNRELNNLYAPIEVKPGWVRRLSTSLAQAVACRAPKELPAARHSQAGAAVKLPRMSSL